MNNESDLIKTSQNLHKTMTHGNLVLYYVCIVAYKIMQLYTMYVCMWKLIVVKLTHLQVCEFKNIVDHGNYGSYNCYIKQQETGLTCAAAIWSVHSCAMSAECALSVKTSANTLKSFNTMNDIVPIEKKSLELLL